MLLVGPILLSLGCSSFNHDWKEAAAREPTTENLQGSWQGVWASDVTGHTDKLRCLISAKQDGTYKARFKANYKKVFTFGYTVPLTVTPTGTNYAFRGEANLGWMAGGMYYYSGCADATNFNSTYSNRYDHGSFRMGRPSTSG